MRGSGEHNERAGPVGRPQSIPQAAGVGLKSEHYTTILENKPDIGWFEVHAENYMGEGGPPHHYLEAVRRDYPISLHGVGLSIGSAGPLDREHLARLKAVNDRYEPGLFSEHLAWSTHDGIFMNDLLPVPYTRETQDRCADHIDLVQETLGRRMLLENPSTYVAFEDSTMSEIEFLTGLSRRSGCGLLLDVNNVYVSAINHGYRPQEYVDAFPMDDVGEIHLGGHATDSDDDGEPLLIDAHDRAVDDQVWTLYERVLSRTGPLPTLIEWDNDVPGWDDLHRDARNAEQLLRQCSTGLKNAIAV